VEVPEFGEAGEEGTLDSAEGEGAQSCGESAEEEVEEDDNRDEDEEHFVDVNDGLSLIVYLDTTTLLP
jgi:hypothetical protein